MVGRRACVLTKRSQGLSKSFTKPYKIQIHRGLPESARRPRNSGSPLNTTHVYTYHPTPGPHTRRPRVPTSTTLIQNVRHHPPSHRERVGPPAHIRRRSRRSTYLQSKKRILPTHPPSARRVLLLAAVAIFAAVVARTYPDDFEFLMYRCILHVSLRIRYPDDGVSWCILNV